jgi:two-component system chemotaxis response regulator CheY
MGKILVVDDSSTMRRIIVNTLARLGFKETDQAEDGVEAWEIYQKDKDNIDAIITDWNMPNMNGLEFVKKVREVDKETPITVNIIVEKGNAKRLFFSIFQRVILSEPIIISSSINSFNSW